MRNLYNQSSTSTGNHTLSKATVNGEWDQIGRCGRRLVSATSDSYDVTIVGYGRYGRLHIGPKYAKTGRGWRVQAIVDPIVNGDSFRSSVLGQSCPNALIYEDFYAWKKYFECLTAAEQRRHVVEIALRPGLVLGQALLYIEAGVKNLILPKPVVTNQAELAALVEAVERHGVKAAVASQWHYSDLPALIGRELRRISRDHGFGGEGRPHLHRVEIEFSKENGRSISTTPPLSELPHVLQLLESTGMVDFSDCHPQVCGTEDCVDVAYHPTHIEAGIHLRSDLDWRPSSSLKARFPAWDVQKRILTAYMTADAAHPVLEMDFWMKFDRSGDTALRPGRLTIRDRRPSFHPHSLSVRVVDDQLLGMLEKIYRSFGQDLASFQRDSRVMSLARYQPIARQLMRIQSLWEGATLPQTRRQATDDSDSADAINLKHRLTA